MEQLLENNQYKDNTNPQSQKYNKPTKGKKKPIKIKYISSPMMVRANNASEFRAIVQELTGQNSNVSDDIPSEDFAGHGYDHHHQITSWFPSSYDHHDYPKVHHGDQLVGDRTDVDDYDNNNNHDDEKYFSNSNSSSIVAPFDDEANHFWRSELVSDQSFNGGFQSPCVFV